MKTRMAVHIALNAKNERVGSLVEAAGRLIPFDGYTFTERLKAWERRTVGEWMNSDYCVEESIADWKFFSRRCKNAVRFQRVTLLGETK